MDWLATIRQEEQGNGHFCPVKPSLKPVKGSRPVLIGPD